jgi:hypothetical protein
MNEPITRRESMKITALTLAGMFLPPIKIRPLITHPNEEVPGSVKLEIGDIEKQ